MLGILFSLMPLVGWGIGDVIASRLSKESHPAAINFVFSVVTGFFTLVIALPFGMPEISSASLAGFMGSSLLLSGGFITMMLGFQRGATGVVSPIANAYAIVTLLVSTIFFDAPATLLLAISVVVVVLGIALLSYEKLDPSIPKKQAYAAVAYALLAMLLFGLGFAVFEVVATQEWYQNATISTVTGFVVSIIVLVFWQFKHKTKEVKKLFKSKILFASSVLNGIAFAGLFLAFENTDNVSIPAAIAAASPLVTLMLAKIFENEKLRAIQYVGAVVVVFGIVLISLSI